MRIITPEFNLIKIGYQGENEAVCVQIGVQNWPELYGAGGTFSLRHQRAGDPDGYPVTVTEADGIVSWVVSNIDTRDPGYGKATLIYKVNDVIAMSVEYSTLTEASVGENPEPPEPWKPWIDEILEARDDAVEAAEDAHEDANSASQSADDASTEALKAEGYAVGTQDGEAVGPDSPYYQKNAKYYYEEITDELGPIQAHLVDHNNPHQVTPSQIGAIEKVEGAVANDLAVLTADGSVADSGVSMTLEEALEGELISFMASAAVPIKALSVALSPIQNLNGYDSPWPAGGGKNKLPNAAADTVTNHYVTFKSNGDGTYSISGTASGGQAVAVFSLVASFVCPASTTNKLVIGNSEANSSASLWLRSGSTNKESWSLSPANKSTTDLGNAAGQTIDAIRFTVNDGQTVNMTLAPMICAATETTDTFAPYSNICPISGRTETTVWRTGVNIWDEITETGGINDTTGANATANNQFRSVNFIPCKPNKNYYICCTTQTTSVYVYFYDANKAFISRAYLNGYNVANKEIATPNNCVYMRFKVQQSGGSTTYNHDISINYPSTATTYAPYTGNAYTIDLNGTVYGGTVNVKTGVLTIDRAILDMGSINWGRGNNGGNWAHYLCYVAITGIKPNADALCEAYPMIITANVNNIPNKTGAVHATAAYVYFRDDDIQTAADFKTAMNGIHLVYELATPITVALTPTEITTLLGDNNVWSDGDSVALTRYKGLAEIIAEIVSELNA